MEDHRPTLPLDWLTRLPVIEHWILSNEVKPVPYTHADGRRLLGQHSIYQNVFRSVIKEFCPEVDELDVHFMSSIHHSVQPSPEHVLMRTSVTASYILPTIYGDLDEVDDVFDPLLTVFAYLFPSIHRGKFHIMKERKPVERWRIAEGELGSWTEFPLPGQVIPEQEPNALFLGFVIYTHLFDNETVLKRRAEEVKAILDDLHHELSTRS